MRFPAAVAFFRRSTLLRASAPGIILGAILSSAMAEESRTKFLTRSIYVPVVFTIAPELGEVELWIQGEDRASSPSPRVFLFTYYPEHRKFLPEQVEVRVRAKGRCGGEPVRSSFLVTSLGIHAGSDSLSYDEKGLGRLVKTRRRDVRLTAKVVRIGCPTSEAAADAPPSGKDDAEGKR